MQNNINKLKKKMKISVNKLGRFIEWDRFSMCVHVKQGYEVLTDDDPLEPSVEDAAVNILKRAVSALQPVLPDSEDAQELEDILQSPHMQVTMAGEGGIY